ncbi:hypothetical protein JYU34_006010 [Plutella xylostella]|uniref:Uncharacterized protein n=1 Tax=Plutella xylostella TaxID=51655 RepID=A0ABQ7QUP5_PLUXY|nr:hypothetical protein JYU34_006010 [Plutella xylostella]
MDNAIVLVEKMPVPLGMISAKSPSTRSRTRNQSVSPSTRKNGKSNGHQLTMDVFTKKRARSPSATSELNENLKKPKIDPADLEDEKENQNIENKEEALTTDKPDPIDKKEIKNNDIESETKSTNSTSDENTDCKKED